MRWRVGDEAGSYDSDIFVGRWVMELGVNSYFVLSWCVGDDANRWQGGCMYYR